MLKDFTKEDLQKLATAEYIDFQESQVESTYESMQNWSDKQWALFEHACEDLDTVEEINNLNDIDTDEIYFNGEHLLVLTDSEADDIWDERLESYLNECVMPEIPDYLQSYFDVESWKRDAKYDGRGLSIAGYDGNENEYFLKYEDGQEAEIYIYRV